VPPEAILVGFVGRLTAVKNPALFLEAAGRVARQFPQTRFVFVGDGELHSTLEKQADALELAEHVIFTGWQVDMPAVYADLDLLALTSLNEGTPVGVIEALAAGTPVVVTKVGGVPDVVRHQETGVLVPSGDAAAVAGGMLQLLRKPDHAQEIALAGQRDVLTRFDLARLTDDMESLYFGLLETKGIHL
jgi:glycosyltransferase involved in cell wall biosynthesis